MAYAKTYSITVDHTKCGSGNTTDFNFLFFGTYDGTGGEPDLRTVGNGGDVQNTVSVGGVTVPADLIFTSDAFGATPLKWEIVSYTASTGQIIAWVKIPTLDASTDTVIYIFYKDAAVTTWQGDVNGTWNSSYLFMIHGSNVETDSTSNGRNFTCSSPRYIAGKFGTGMDANTVDVNSYPTRTDAGLPTGTSSRTIKMWVNWPTSAYPNTSFFAYGNQGTAEQDQRIRQSAFTGGGEVLKYLASSDDAVATFNPTISQFYYLVCTFNASGTVAKIYIDGSNLSTTTKASWNTVLGGVVSMGKDAFGSGTFYLQDVAMRDVVESADEILAAYNNQNDPATFYSLAINSADITLFPSAGSITFTGATPTIDADLSPVAAALVFTGGTPTVSTVGFNLTPATGTIVFTGGTPVVNFTILRPDTGVISFLGSTPGVSLVTTAATGNVAVIGGVSYLWDDTSPALIAKRMSGAWSATFSLVYSGGSKPAPGDEVALFWQSVKRFGGIVLSVAESRIKGPANVTRILVTCTGFQSYLNRAIVAKLYTIPISGWPIMIFDIWNDHLKDFGITLVYPQGPLTGFDEKLFHYITVGEIFNRCRDENSGYDYWITDDKALIWSNQGSGGAAPFTLRNGDVNQDSVTVTRNNSKFRNKQWVLPSANIIALKTESFTAAAGQTSFSTIYNLNDTPIVTLGGVGQSVTTLGIWDGSPWYYIPGGIGVFRTPGAPAISGGAAVTISYLNPFPVGFSAQNDASIAAVGLYESVYQAKNVIDSGTATALATALLALYGTSGNYPEYLNFTYNSHSQPAWLLPGMVVDVLRTYPDATGNYVVEAVSSTLEKLQVWRHSVTLRLGKGDVSESFERDFLAAARVPIVSPPIRATFEMDMTNEGQFVGISPNRYTVQLPPGVAYATIASWDWWFPSSPPAGADYKANILLNGSIIVQVVVPDGSSAVQSGIEFSAANIQVGNGDYFSIDVIQVGSTNPGRYSLGHLNMIV